LNLNEHPAGYGIRNYFAFFAFSALIFAHRALAARAIFAFTAADIVLLPLVPFVLLTCPDDTAALPPPFNAAMALLTAVNCRSNFASSVCNASTMFMKPPWGY
jgi:membrane-associated HD superfamily phosphohydrolase